MIVLPAGPARASVDVTGSVATTDITGEPTTVFVRGQHVYSNVGLEYYGTPYDGTIRVELRRATDGAIVSSFNSRSNNPVIGWNNGSSSGLFLNTVTGFSGSVMACNVIAYYTGGGFNDMVAMTPILVRAEGLSINPPSGPYYPGENVALKLVTSHTSEGFYVQVVNETGYTRMNWTGQMAPTGVWNASWQIPSDMPDGDYSINVRDAVTHAYWLSTGLNVMKYQLVTSQDRSYYLPGETALIYYLVLDTATLSPSAGVSMEFSAHWLNESGSDSWTNGSLPGNEGTHELLIPADAAIYEDVEIVYWANETSANRSSRSVVMLYLSELVAYLEVQGSTFRPGEVVEVSIAADADPGALPGATVNLIVEFEGTVIPAYGANDLVTDSSGNVVHRFTLDMAAEAGTYVVRATIEKVGHSSLTMTVFNVQISGSIIVEFDKAYYYGGDTAQIQLKTVMNGEQIIGQNLTYIIAMDFVVLYSGQNTTGVLSYNIPADSYGLLIVEAVANVDGIVLSGFSACDVIVAELAISAEASEYSPGDTIVFIYQIFTNLIDGAIEWEILDDYGVRVASGTPAFSKSGNFSYVVPGTWSADSYIATVSLRTPSGQYMDATETVDKAMVPPVTMLPFLRVDSPLEGAVTGVPVIYASGSTEPGVIMNVNGFTVLAVPSGVFSLNLPLLEGLNVVTIMVDNGWGTTTITRNVTFLNPVPALVSQISQLELDLALGQSMMSTVWSELNSTAEDVSQAWAQLNASEAVIEDVRDIVNATESSLASLQVELDALRAEVTETHSGLNDTDGGVLSLEASIDAIQAQMDSTRSSLNSTRTELAAAQTQLDSLETDLGDAQADIGAKAAESSVTTMFVLAVVITLALVAALFMLLRRKA
jgi:peptidoglycan hydrolase CwlO-like protein